MFNSQFDLCHNINLSTNVCYLWEGGALLCGEGRRGRGAVCEHVQKRDGNVNAHNDEPMEPSDVNALFPSVGDRPLPYHIWSTAIDRRVSPQESRNLSGLYDNLLECSPFGVKEGREETVCASPHHPLPRVADSPSQWLWPFAPDLRTNISFTRSSESECTWMIVCMCIRCVICTIWHVTVACEMLLFINQGLDIMLNARWNDAIATRLVFDSSAFIKALVITLPWAFGCIGWFSKPKRVPMQTWFSGAFGHGDAQKCCPSGHRFGSKTLPFRPAH